MDNEELVGCSGSCGTCGGCGSSDEESLPILVLTDENGKEVTFEKLDVVVLEDGRSFLIVSEVKEDYDEEVEVVILEIKEEDGEQVYDTLTDEELLKEYETRIVAFKIATISSAKLPKGYTPERLKFINKYLFEEVYEFAGEYRKAEGSSHKDDRCGCAGSGRSGDGGRAAETDGT